MASYGFWSDRLNTLSILNQLPCRRSIAETLLTRACTYFAPTLHLSPILPILQPSYSCPAPILHLLHLSCTYPAPILHLSCFPAPILYLSDTCLLFVWSSSSRRRHCRRRRAAVVAAPSSSRRRVIVACTYSAPILHVSCTYPAILSCTYSALSCTGLLFTGRRRRRRCANVVAPWLSAPWGGTELSRYDKTGWEEKSAEGGARKAGAWKAPRLRVQLISGGSSIYSAPAERSCSPCLFLGLLSILSITAKHNITRLLRESQTHGPQRQLLAHGDGDVLLQKRLVGCGVSGTTAVPKIEPSASPCSYIISTTWRSTLTSVISLIVRVCVLA